MTFKDIRSALWTPRSSFNKAFKASETFNHLDGSKHYTWPAVRRQNINKLISDLVHITIFLTASGTLGPEQAKYTPGGNDQSKYGIVYHLGRFGWWAFALLIAIPVGVLWFPLLKWITPPSSTRTITEIVTDEHGVSHTIIKETPVGINYILQLVNKYLYACLAYVRVFEFIFHLYETILHVNARPVHSSPSTFRATDVRRTWLARVGLGAGMLTGVGLGAPVMMLWYWLDLVHVTRQEYVLIIVPVQMTIGIALASVLQATFEKKTELLTERELFEKEANGNLTLEGMRQALSFLVNSEIDMKALQNIGRGKYNDKEQKGTVKKYENKDEENDVVAKKEKKNDGELAHAPSKEYNEKLVEV